jgi:hypothetical protein
VPSHPALLRPPTGRGRRAQSLEQVLYEDRENDGAWSMWAQQQWVQQQRGHALPQPQRVRSSIASLWNTLVGLGAPITR